MYSRDSTLLIRYYDYTSRLSPLPSPLLLHLHRHNYHFTTRALPQSPVHITGRIVSMSTSTVPTIVVTSPEGHKKRLRTRPRSNLALCGLWDIKKTPLIPAQNFAANPYSVESIVEEARAIIRAQKAAELCGVPSSTYQYYFLNAAPAQSNFSDPTMLTAEFLNQHRDLWNIPELKQWLTIPKYERTTMTIVPQRSCTSTVPSGRNASPMMNARNVRFSAPAREIIQFIAPVRNISTVTQLTTENLAANNKIYELPARRLRRNLATCGSTREE